MRGYNERDSSEFSLASLASRSRGSAMLNTRIEILVGECSAFLASGSDPTDSDGQSMRKTMKIIIDHIQISRRLYNCDHSTST